MLLDKQLIFRNVCLQIKDAAGQILFKCFFRIQKCCWTKKLIGKHFLQEHSLILLCKTKLYFIPTPLEYHIPTCSGRVGALARTGIVGILVNGCSLLSLLLLDDDDVSTIPLIFKASAVCRKLCRRFCGTDTVPWYMYVTRASSTW